MRLLDLIPSSPMDGRPADYAEMLKHQASDSGQRLDSPGAFAILPPERVWGLPVVISRIMPENHALIGAFRTACRVFVREPISIRLSDSDQDDFLRNRASVLAEMRAGFAVWQADAFAVVDLTV